MKITGIFIEIGRLMKKKFQISILSLFIVID